MYYQPQNTNKYAYELATKNWDNVSLFSIGHDVLTYTFT